MFLTIQILYLKALLDLDFFLQPLVTQVYTIRSNVFHSDEPIKMLNRWRKSLSLVSWKPIRVRP